MSISAKVARSQLKVDIILEFVHEVSDKQQFRTECIERTCLSAMSRTIILVMEVSKLRGGIKESGAAKVRVNMLSSSALAYEDGARPVYEPWTTAGDLRYGHDDASPAL